MLSLLLNVAMQFLPSVVDAVDIVVVGAFDVDAIVTVVASGVAAVVIVLLFILLGTTVVAAGHIYFSKTVPLQSFLDCL